MIKNIKILHNLIIVILAGCLMTSCFKDEETDLSSLNDLIISKVSFGTLPREIYTKGTTGNDSIYMTTLNASTEYPFTIDQTRNLIYNVDSLPYGVRPDKIIFSAFTVADGTVTLRTLTTDKDSLYQIADTLDFSQGYRIFNLYGADRTSKRQYRVEARIHKQATDSVTWTKYTVEDFISHKPAAKLPVNEYEAAGRHFCISEGAIYESLNDDEEPQMQELDDDADNLPNDNFAWATTPSRAYDYIQEVFLYGTRKVDEKYYGKLWRRNIDTTGNHQYIWEYLPGTIENFNRLPSLHDAGLYAFDEGLLIVGLDNDSLINLKYSAEHGRTWKYHNALRLPTDLKSRKVSSLKSYVDADCNLWILIDNDEVWRGRAHRVTWKKEQTTFDK